MNGSLKSHHPPPLRMQSLLQKNCVSRHVTRILIMHGKQNETSQAILKRSPCCNTHYTKTRQQQRKDMQLILVMPGFMIFLSCCHSRKINTKDTFRSLDMLEKGNILKSLDTLVNGNIL
jgi:hypothetical protein